MKRTFFLSSLAATPVALSLPKIPVKDIAKIGHEYIFTIKKNKKSWGKAIYRGYLKRGEHFTTIRFLTKVA